MVVDNANTNGFRGLCLSPEDLAISKLVAGRQKDFAFVSVLIKEQIVLAPTLKTLLLQVPELDVGVRDRLLGLINRFASGRENAP